MDRLLLPRRAHRGSRLPTLGPRTRRLGWLALVLLVVVVPVAASALGAPVVPARSPSAPAAPAHVAAAPVRTATSEGDVTVTAANSPFVIQGGSYLTSEDLVQGNITVEAGGTLVVRNITLVQEEFVGGFGTTAQRLDHLYTISDQGTIDLDHAVLESYTAAINPYPKIDLNVSGGGALSLNASALLFAGWLSIYGAGSSLTLTNHSLIGPNPAAAGLVTNATISNDTRYAPVLTAGNGARVSFFQSVYNGTYQFNLTKHFPPGPAVQILDPTTRTLSDTAAGTWSAFTLDLPQSAQGSPYYDENLTRAVLYRSITSLVLTIDYTASADTTSTGDSVGFDGLAAFGPVDFTAGTGALQVPMPAGVVSAINNGSFPTFLAELDNDGANITLGALSSAATVAVDGLEFNATAAWQYNLTFWGPGTTLTAVDSSFDINWNLTPGSPYPNDVFPPTPWGSNKLLLEDGAVGYFANVTVPVGPSRATGNESAVVTDPTSTAVFYRWFDVDVQGPDGAAAGGADVAAYYQLNNVQQDNETATALNDLAATSPEIANYVAAQDVADGAPGYGVSNASGVARLLLASTELTYLTQPDGLYLGGYHLAVGIPGVPNGSRWISGSVSPYPTNMSPASPDGPRAAVVFENFAPRVAISTTSLLVNGVTNSNATVAIGENLTAQVTIQNVGAGPVTNVSAELAYQDPPAAPVVVAGPVYPGALATDASVILNLTWLVNETVTGLEGTIASTFIPSVTWNRGVAPTGGTTASSLPVTVVPAYIHLTFTPPTSRLLPAEELLTTGTVTYAGNHSALVNVTAIGANGARYLLGSSVTRPGSFQVFVTPLLNMSAGTYSLNISAYYNHRYVYLSYPASLLVGAPPSAAAVPWYQHSVLGLPLYLWLVLIVVIVAAALGFLMWTRRRSKGKLVECGECGELIPENVTACPKCGAEFETDLVRCSRCSSTIPAKSAQCPECSAQLLGTETPDPERQGFQDFVEKFRTEARKELGENYSEGAFWEWWKRQPSYVSFDQWKAQQAQGSRAGMAAPPPGGPPPSGPVPVPTPTTPSGPRSASDSPSPRAASAATSPPAPAAAPPPAAESGGAGPAMKPCASCGKEIPPDYLVCPFCGAVTR